MSESSDWDDLLFLAKLIPRVCHNVNRVCYIFGQIVRHPVQDITVTHLTSHVISTVRQADHLVNQVLAANDCMGAIAQMPVVLIPVHFDRLQNAILPALDCPQAVLHEGLYDWHTSYSWQGTANACMSTLIKKKNIYSFYIQDKCINSSIFGTYMTHL